MRRLLLLLPIPRSSWRSFRRLKPNIRATPYSNSRAITRKPLNLKNTSPGFRRLTRHETTHVRLLKTRSELFIHPRNRR